MKFIPLFCDKYYTLSLSMIENTQDFTISNQSGVLAKVNSPTIYIRKSINKSQRARKIFKKEDNIFKRNVQTFIDSKLGKKQLKISEKLPSMTNQNQSVSARLSLHANREFSTENRKNDVPTQKLIIAQAESQQKQKYSPRVLKKLSSLETTITNQTKSLLKVNHTFSDYQLIDRSQIIFKKGVEPETFKQLTAFYSTRCCYVRLIRADNIEDQICQVQEDEQRLQKRFVKIYGKVKVKFVHFIVTESLEGMSLQNYIQQYGSCNQRFIKKCIRQIIKSLMHYNWNGNTFNNLTPSKVFINGKGEVKIDTIRSHSSGRVNNEDIRKDLFYLAPQLLILNKGSISNDIWSIGCIALDMITGGNDLSCSELHPYNNIQLLKQKFRKGRCEKQCFDKLVKLKKMYVPKNQVKLTIENNKGAIKLSQSLYRNKLAVQNRVVSQKRPTQMSKNLVEFFQTCFYSQQEIDFQDLLHCPFLKQEGFFY